MHPMDGPGGIDELLHTLGADEYEVPMPGGRGTLVFTRLPGRCVSAAVEDNGHLWVMIDLRKPSAHRHAWLMVAKIAGSRAFVPAQRDVVSVRVA